MREEEDWHREMEMGSDVGKKDDKRDEEGKREVCEKNRHRDIGWERVVCRRDDIERWGGREL